MQDTSQIQTTTLLEQILAILAALLSLIVTIFLWWSVNTLQPMWPLPALYFIEMAVLGSLSAFIFFRGTHRGKFIVWDAAGAMIGFTILGALSVGFFYLPVVLIFAAIFLTSDVRTRQPIAAHLGVCLVAGVVQVMLMLAVVQLFH